jgi:hypothetical protein
MQSQEEEQSQEIPSSPVRQPMEIDDADVDEREAKSMADQVVFPANGTSIPVIRVTLPDDLFDLPAASLRSSMDEEEPVPASELTSDQAAADFQRLDDLAGDPSITAYIRIMWESVAESMHGIFARRRIADMNALVRTSCDMESFFLQYQLYRCRKRQLQITTSGNSRAIRKNSLSTMQEMMQEDEDFFFFPETFSLLGSLPDLAAGSPDSHSLFQPGFAEDAL